MILMSGYGHDNLPLAWHAATDMSAIGWVMIAYSSNCLISQEWLASIAEGDSIINATLLIKTSHLLTETSHFQVSPDCIYSSQWHGSIVY